MKLKKRIMARMTIYLMIIVSILNVGAVGTPLHDAAETGDVYRVQCLCEQYPHWINERDYFGNTPLHYAVNCRPWRKLELGVSDDDSLKLARLNVIKCLLAHKANPNARDNEGNAPLHFAASLGILDAVKCLVENGADIDVSNSAKNCPLNLAVEYRNFEVIKYLVERGANVNVRDWYGNTPIYTEIDIGGLDIVKFLVEHGANVNVCNVHADTPLHIASKRKKLDIIKYLMSQGALATTKNHRGKIPLDYILPSIDDFV